MATFKKNMPACSTCACGGGTTVCGSGVVGVSFNPVCSAAISGGSLSVTYTPDDGTAPTTSSGSGTIRSVATTHVPGVFSYTFTSTNYLTSSGSFPVTTCNPGVTSITAYPNTYQVCVRGCNIVTDGTSVTVTASGSVSGSCSPTATTVGGIPSLCCTFSVSSPVTVAPTISVTAARYQVASTSSTASCQTIVTMIAATGYFCCDPTGTGTCPPIKTSLSLSTPLGTYTFTLGAAGSPAITATVLSIPPALVGGVLQAGCGAPGGTPAPTSNAVTFFLTAFTCSSGGFGGTISYTGCTYPTNGPCSTDVVAQADDHCCQNTITGQYQFSLSGTCPPGQLGTFASEVCHNRYLSGGYTLTEV